MNLFWSLLSCFVFFKDLSEKTFHLIWMDSSLIYRTWHAFCFQHIRNVLAMNRSNVLRLSSLTKRCTCHNYIYNIKNYTRKYIIQWNMSTLLPNTTFYITVYIKAESVTSKSLVHFKTKTDFILRITIQSLKESYNVHHFLTNHNLIIYTMTV